MAKRLDKELAEFAKGGQEWVEVYPKGGNRFELVAKISGPVIFISILFYISFIIIIVICHNIIIFFMLLMFHSQNYFYII